jgi:hypothetical protein
MITRTSILLTVFLTAAGLRPAAASTLNFEHDGGGVASVGAEGFFLSVNVLAGTDPFHLDMAGDLDFTTGAADVVSPNAQGGFDFHFVGGQLAFDFGADGRAVIPVLPFTISLSDAIYPQIWENWEPPTALVARMLSSPDLILGAGRLDAILAQRLDVQRRTLGGTAFMVVDDFLPTPLLSDPQHYDAVPNFISGRIALREAPEPQLVSLLVVGGLAVVRRRRRAR